MTSAFESSILTAAIYLLGFSITLFIAHFKAFQKTANKFHLYVQTSSDKIEERHLTAIKNTSDKKEYAFPLIKERFELWSELKEYVKYVKEFHSDSFKRYLLPATILFLVTVGIYFTSWTDKGKYSFLVGIVFLGSYLLRLAGYSVKLRTFSDGNYNFEKALESYKKSEKRAETWVIRLSEFWFI